MVTPTPRAGVGQSVARAAIGGNPGGMGGRRPGLSPVRGTESLRGVETPADSPAAWTFSNGEYADGALTPTTVLAGADGVEIPFASTTLLGSPAGLSVGTSGGDNFISFDRAGLFMVYVSVSASGGGTGFVNLTFAEVSLFADTYSSSAQFGLWVPVPRDESVSSFSSVIISNLTTTDVFVTGDISVYPAILA